MKVGGAPEDARVEPGWRDGPRASLLPGRDGPARALAGVIAILAFLAALAAAGAAAVTGGVASWSAALGGEATIQVRPEPGLDPEAGTSRAAELARATPGVAEAAIVPRRESERLIEPWLGQGLDLQDLPVPRLVTLRLQPGGVADLAGLADRLRAVPGASLDDHSAWKARLAAYGRGIVSAALLLFGLVLLATGLAVAFATRGAIAGSRDVVEVLDLIGATSRFIAGEYARRFRRLGWTGGLLGAGAAIAVVAAVQTVAGGSLPLAARAAPLLAAALVAPCIAGIASVVSAASVKRFLSHSG